MRVNVLAALHPCLPRRKALKKNGPEKASV